MKNLLMLLCLTTTALTSSCAFAQTPVLPAQFGPHQWTATVKVIGEDGNPIIGADVAVSYDIPAAPGSSSQTYGEIKGLTDTNGMFSASHTDRSLGLAVIAQKAGYYTTHIGHQFYYEEKNRRPAFTLLLKQIGKPIAMYAKKEETKMPKEKEPVGFDLMIGDWIAPYGAGKTADVFFTVNRKIISSKEFDADLELTFPNAGDGVVIIPPAPDTGSELAMPHTAAEIGYQSSLTWHYHNFIETAEPASGYFIRVRTVLDSNGSVKSALYGKIHGDVRLMVGSKAPRAGIALDYYLNPTPNSKNVEFDPKQNLMENLPFDEQVSQP